MAKKKSSWVEIKKVLPIKEQKKLLQLLKDLYDLDDRNRRFFESRFCLNTASVSKYKKIISKSLYPDCFDEDYEISLSTARKAISDFKKASDSTQDLLELMVCYVEEGTNCTCDYGDMYEEFYCSLESMFNSTIKLLKKSEVELTQIFLPRLQKVVSKAKNTGWGYYDQISGFLYDAFPEIDDNN